MKYMTRWLTLVLVLALFLCTVPAANAQVIVLDPDETKTITLEYSDVCAIEGEILFSDKTMVSSITYERSDDGMLGMVGNDKIFLYTDNMEGMSGKIIIKITIGSSAKKGSSCKVTIRYRTTAPGSEFPGEEQTLTYTVTVRTESPLPVEPDPPKPTYADTTELKAQIAIAEALTYFDYTKESWAAVDAALTNARSLLDSTSQSAVDKATASLKSALHDLVRMDYSALLDALSKAEDMSRHPEIAQIWVKYIRALENAMNQRTSGDQAAVDAATLELNACKEELLKALDEMGEVVVVEKEVEVEVEPNYTFCNNTGHTVRLILLIISLVLNVAMLAVIGWYLYKKYYKNKQDTTPLVEYNIEDDEIDQEALEEGAQEADGEAGLNEAPQPAAEDANQKASEETPQNTAEQA